MACYVIDIRNPRKACFLCSFYAKFIQKRNNLLEMLQEIIFFMIGLFGLECYMQRNVGGDFKMNNHF